MTRQIKNSEGSMYNLLDELRSIEASLDENNLARMKGLRETETKFQTFLSSFPTAKAKESELLKSKETAILELLEKLKTIKCEICLIGNFEAF